MLISKIANKRGFKNSSAKLKLSEMRMKIYFELMPYIYPKRKPAESGLSEVRKPLELKYRLDDEVKKKDE